MFLDGDGVVRSALDTVAVNICDVDNVLRDSRAVIGDNHAHGTLDCANARDNASGSYVFSRVHLMAGQS